MKKSIKLIVTIVLALMLTFTFAQPIVFAEGVSDITNAIKTNTVDTSSTGANTVVSNIASWIWWISVVVAVLVLMYTGLKFIFASTQEKAEYKKSLVPIVVGVAVLVFATTIVNLLFSLGGTATGK